MSKTKNYSYSVSVQKMLKPKHTLGGRLDEYFTWNDVDVSQVENSILNLSGVNAINSVGVRTWIQNNPFKERGVEIEEASNCMMLQFQSIPSMLKGFLLKSFHLEVECSNEHMWHALIILRSDHKNLIEQFNAALVCKTCSDTADADFVTGGMDRWLEWVKTVDKSV